MDFNFQEFQKESSEITGLLGQCLHSPLFDLFSRPKKNIRSELVPLGLRLAKATIDPQDLTRAQALSDVLEALHGASLIIDDIEDNSQMRRGQPSMHVKFGVPKALNAANWLYFWPFQRIKELRLPLDMELEIYRAYHETMLRAHYGQALDVGVQIHLQPKREIPGICMKSIELKTGALMAFALEAGGLLAGAGPSRLKVLSEFGKDLGMALQIFDDIGNLQGSREVSATYNKRFEDLTLLRPTWIWAMAAQILDDKDFKEFCELGSLLPDEGSKVEVWLKEHGLVSKAYESGLNFLNKSLARLNDELINAADFDLSALKEIKELAERLTKAYGSK